MKYFCLLLCITVLMSGCASDDLTNKTLTHSPDFAPVYPLASDANRIPTGGIYGNRQSDAWFGRGRNFQVGDIITVLLDESTQAARTSNSDLSRESKNAGLPSGLSTEVGKVSPFLQGIDLSSSNMTSKGKGVADQKATLKGSLAVTVVEVLANGNLMVRGEKKLGLAEGTEVIQVSGIIRPQDVGPNSTVQSLRLANAQIAYRGNGDVANAAKAGWGTSALHRFWPF
ncbi:MAG: flagellar basal body L-ring protein FlgH [Betaproteobacteria bacterium]|jgi:flagellar L-ring protein precursor FlgH|nr:flagellar basal body L-ring protein FlgH [Betaproteobacteria bacterium]